MLALLESNHCPNFVRADIERAKRHKSNDNVEELNCIEKASQQPDWVESIRPGRYDADDNVDCYNNENKYQN